MQQFVFKDPLKREYIVSKSLRHHLLFMPSVVPTLGVGLQFVINFAVSTFPTFFIFKMRKKSFDRLFPSLFILTIFWIKNLRKWLVKSRKSISSHFSCFNTFLAVYKAFLFLRLKKASTWFILFFKAFFNLLKRIICCWFDIITEANKCK